MLTTSVWFHFVILTYYFLGAKIEYATDYWSEESDKSIALNVHGQCKQNIVSPNSFSADFSHHDLIISKHFPSQDEVIAYRDRPSTLTKGNPRLIEIINTTRVRQWAADTAERWVVHPDHPGQNRKMCINNTRIIGLGHVTNRFYNMYQNIPRTTYLVQGKNALIDHSGAVMFSCGFYQGYEGWETRWEQPKDWDKKCRLAMKENHLSYDSLLTELVREVSPKFRDCSYNATKAVRHSKVFVIAGSMDDNFHHLIADSLSRVPRYLPFLRSNPDIKVHIRMWERDEKKQYQKPPKEQKLAKKSREMLLQLLGIEPERLVSHTIVADHVYIPRYTAMSDSLKNPMEVRLLAKEFLDGAYKEVERRVKNPPKLPQIQFADIPSLFEKSSSHTHHQVDYPDQYDSAKKNLIVLIRKNKGGWGSRHWTDEVNKQILLLFQKTFPDHTVIPHFSDAIQHPDFCMACEIIELNRADILVGIHGAGLTKEMFMPAGSLLVELSPHINAAQMVSTFLITLYTQLDFYNIPFFCLFFVVAALWLLRKLGVIVWSSPLLLRV